MFAIVTPFLLVCLYRSSEEQMIHYGGASEGVDSEKHESLSSVSKQ